MVEIDQKKHEIIQQRKKEIQKNIQKEAKELAKRHLKLVH